MVAPSDNETGSACAAFGRSGETGASSQVVSTKWILEPKGLHETSCGRRFGTRERYQTAQLGTDSRTTKSQDTPSAVETQEGTL